MLISLSTLWNLWLFFLLLVDPCLGVCIDKRAGTSTSTIQKSSNGRCMSRIVHPSLEDPHHHPQSRRNLFQTTCASLLGAAAAILSTPTRSVLAVDQTTTPTASTTTTTTTTSSTSEILLRLKSIPTFSIVDPNGVPFMIFDGRASATGYFFLSFQVAAQALQDARQKDTNAGAKELWSQAKIIVVPLAVALQLALRKSQREAVNNGIKFNAYNDIVPSQEGVDDAKELEKNNDFNANPAKWEQKGRVPLFYIPGLTLADGREPRYFNTRDLLLEWEKQHPDKSPPPPIQIVELVELFRVGLKSGGGGGGGDGDGTTSIANLVIMPVPETNQIASKLLKSTDGGTVVLPSYNFNKVFLVGSSQG